MVSTTDTDAPPDRRPASSLCVCRPARPPVTLAAAARPFDLAEAAGATALELSPSLIDVRPEDDEREVELILDPAALHPAFEAASGH